MAEKNHCKVIALVDEKSCEITVHRNERSIKVTSLSTEGNFS